MVTRNGGRKHRLSGELDEARRKDGLKTPAQVPMNDMGSLELRV